MSFYERKQKIKKNMRIINKAKTYLSESYTFISPCESRLQSLGNNIDLSIEPNLDDLVQKVKNKAGDVPYRVQALRSVNKELSDILDKLQKDLDNVVAEEEAEAKRRREEVKKQLEEARRKREEEEKRRKEQNQNR